MGRPRKQPIVEWRANTIYHARELLDLLTASDHDQAIKRILDFRTEDQRVTTQIAMLIHRLNDPKVMP